MTLLADLFNKYGTDKDKNGYTPVYFALTRELRAAPILRLLEIGIGTMVPGAPSSMHGYALPGYAPGGSLRAWRDWLPNAFICGIDVAEDTLFEDDRIRTHRCDSLKREEVEKLFVAHDCFFDLVIDDGSHNPNDQLTTLTNCYPLVAGGGTYVIEDVVGHASSPLLNAWRPALESIVGKGALFHSAGLIVISKESVEDRTPVLR